MDEARRVLDRLARIEALREAGSDRAELLPELRALLREGQEWVASEGEGTTQAAAALSALDEQLAVAARAPGCKPIGKEVVEAEAVV